MARKACHFLFFSTLLGASMASELNSTIATVLIVGNSTFRSPNRTFELGFFCPNAGVACFLAIWYASLPIRTVVWVANRAAPVPRRPGSPSALLTHPDGRLAVADSSGSFVWLSDNPRPASSVRLLNSGNLLLLSPGGATVWQSFDHPADTWLPDMAVTPSRPLVSWRSPSDPSPGLYSLRLRGGEFKLEFSGSASYWSTGKWTGKLFAGVPEMTVQYIYNFSFSDPFGPNASFSYSVVSAPTEGAGPVLTRFVVDSSGQLMQYIWSQQAASWDMFWSRPASVCRVYGRCGSLGLCVGGLRPCDCPSGFRPADSAAWSSGDFSGGCSRDDDFLCYADGFKEIGAVDFDGAVTVEISGVSRSSCEDSCWRNCSCFGLNYDSETSVCRNLYGNAYNLRNSTDSRIFFLRVSASMSDNFSKKSKATWKKTMIIAISCGGLSAILGPIALLVVVLIRNWRREGKGGGEEDEGAFSNVKVFTYKELLAATRGFSKKLGHGSFGAVFRGELPDSSSVAVKRLERPVGGGGDREFRAEVRTIGSVHHVNLVRLRGFCSDDPHRILVYDYMPLGSLSAYLCRDRRLPLSWAASFRIAVGTAKGIAYLHEECRDRIIHCDIKPENILLDGDFTPKVSDFGLAKLVGRDRSRVMTAMRGTRGYVAPEWIAGTAITAKADVYSYGMMLLEILGGRRNVEASAPPEAEDGWFFPHWAARRIVEGEVAAVVDPALEGEYDRGEAERAARVAVWCIQDEEAARPSMGTVVKMLEGTVEVTVPLLPRLLEALVAGDSFPPVGGISSSWSGGRSDGRSSAGAAESDRIGEAESRTSELQNLTS
ncbi:G-type lectin S-receptor-like serine/threonine-protein kinase SD2-2 [Elaeis guineensis]|uniref:Receptor-like serine/threonine-protein kinase n=1 Tax=Elaeis guineensis var. tenera TaxID=51953 RepID=A0A6I9S1W1_ELAGV|nr:G-type lectin S-receptor-like serine/threonine-protein kinase SD2-2 [Elaeis guineensis]